MRRSRLILIVCAGLVALGVALYFFVPRPRNTQEESIARPKPEAPPDLEKLRDSFTAGREALQKGEAADAIARLTSFTFGNRAVEEYRLYLLANAYQLKGDQNAARKELAALWARNPRMASWEDAGITLSDLYSRNADWMHAASAAGAVADKTDNATVAASARWTSLEASFYAGDVSSLLAQARATAVRSPKATQAVPAIAVIRALSGTADDQPIHLSAAERLERGVCLMRDGDPQNAYDELTALSASAIPDSLKSPLQLNRGLALAQLRRFEDSNKLLEPLASGPYKIAIPAIYTSARNYRVLSASINPMVAKTITVKQQVGTTKVKAKGKKKATTKPRFANVKKTVQLVDLAKKAKRDQYDHLSVERLKDLLSLPLAPTIRIEVLNTLASIAESKNQDEYEQTLITSLVAVDPNADAGLQHFWDKAWAAYERGDLNGARPLFSYLQETFHNENVRRAAAYWMARIDERAGRKDAARAAYAVLAAAPYDDVYALWSAGRGAHRQTLPVSPLSSPASDWRDVAEKSMPAELRLAYELTALADPEDALRELRRNGNASNQHFADALMADYLSSKGNIEEMMRTLKKAFPDLASVAQDSVPPYFLRLYYPIKYEESIQRHAKKNGVDPYLVMGLIHQESQFNPKNRSPVGAIGLMQLMPATGKELGGKLHPLFSVSKLDNPDTNIEIGTYHLKNLINLFGGNTQLAIVAYNAGQGRVTQWKRASAGKAQDELIESIPFRETRTYVKHVVMLESSYRRLYGK